MSLLLPPLTVARTKDIRCLQLRNQQALKRLRTLKTEGWSTMGADAVDGIAGVEMTLRDDGGKGPRRVMGESYHAPSSLWQNLDN